MPAATAARPGTRGARADARSHAASCSSAQPADFEIGYRHVRAEGRRAATATNCSPRRCFRFAARRRATSRARIKELLQQAHRHPAAASAQCRLGVPQSARRSCGAADRGLRSEGLRDRRRAGVGKACQLHRQPGRRGQRRRDREADRARAADGRAKTRAWDCIAEVQIVGETRVTARLRQGGGAARRHVRRARGLADERRRACWRRCAAAASMRMPSIRPSATCSTLKARGLRARLHRAARALRRGRHGAGRAGTAGHSLYRQRRAGSALAHGQVAHQAGVAGGAASPRRAMRCSTADERLGSGGGATRPAADREAGARGFEHRHHQGERGARAAAAYRGGATTTALVLAEQFIDGGEYTAASSATRRCR